MDRVSEIQYGGLPYYRYAYDASSNLGYHQDLANNINYRYFYDVSDRLAMIKNSLGNNTSYDYDPDNNISKLTEVIGGQTFLTS